MAMPFDAVADLGPSPTWKQVVEMREEVERLRSDLQGMAANRDDLLQRNTELEAEVADLRAKLAKEADADRPIGRGDNALCPECNVFTTGGVCPRCNTDYFRATPAEVAEFERREREEAKPSIHVDLSGRKIPPIPAGWRLVTDYAEEPHQEALASLFGDWEWRGSSTGKSYHRDCTYTVPLAYDTPIPWHGGPCPVAEETNVVVEFRVGDGGPWRAGDLGWEHKGRAGDVVSYKVPAPKPTLTDDQLRDIAAKKRPAAEWYDDTLHHMDATGGESVAFATRGMEVADAR